MKTRVEIQDILIEKWLHVLVNNEVEVTDPFDVAKKENILVNEVDLSSISENLAWFIHYHPDRDSYTIWISSKDHPNRKRFTLAHELWHYFLHPDILKAEGTYIENNILFRWWDYSEQEQEANMFAAEYLMPEKQVRQLYEKYGVIEILAWFFSVSNLAMAYRIDNLFKE